MPNKKHVFSHSFLLFVTLGVSLLYWTYLFFTTQPEIKWDSFDYEHLGTMISQQGWGEFFKTGPNREPLYPFLISLCMNIANSLHLAYLKVLVFVQFILLLITQLLTFKILRKLDVKPVVNALIVLYIGISPVLINCAFSLYSEILIIALIPAAILLLSRIFKDVSKYKTTHIVLRGIGVGLILTVLTLTKGIFEVAGPLILISTLFIALRLAPKANGLKKWAALILVGLLTFFSVLTAYKATNKHFNGNFTLTNRGAWALYGFSARRTEPMTQERILAGLTFIPGEGACKKFYSEEECKFWSFYHSDELGVGKLKELMAQGLDGEALDKELLRLSIEQIKINPGQYAMLTAAEGFKILFWESTKLGFVIYPGWLTTLYDNQMFKDSLRLFFAVLSLIAFLSGIKALQRLKGEEILILFFILSTIFFYAAVYSLFVLGTRYAVPVAPLFLCLIALWIQRFQR